SPLLARRRKRQFAILPLPGVKAFTFMNRTVPCIHVSRVFAYGHKAGCLSRQVISSENTVRLLCESDAPLNQEACGIFDGKIRFLRFILLCNATEPKLLSVSITQRLRQ